MKRQPLRDFYWQNNQKCCDNNHIKSGFIKNELFKQLQKLWQFTYDYMFECLIVTNLHRLLYILTNVDNLTNNNNKNDNDNNNNAIKVDWIEKHLKTACNWII